MPQPSLNSPKFINSDLAAQARPELERIVREIQQCLDRFAALNESFRQNFLKLFEETPEAGDQAPPSLLNAYLFYQANLPAHALAHLRYAADLADLACGLLPPSPVAG